MRVPDEPVAVRPILKGYWLVGAVDLEPDTVHRLTVYDTSAENKNTYATISFREESGGVGAVITPWSLHSFDFWRLVKDHPEAVEPYAIREGILLT